MGRLPVKREYRLALVNVATDKIGSLTSSRTGRLALIDYRCPFPLVNGY